jgi:hypothetical protein
MVVPALTVTEAAICDEPGEVAKQQTRIVSPALKKRFLVKFRTLLKRKFHWPL